MDEMTAAMLAQIQEIEAKDESQILAELAGETVAQYIYVTENWEWVPQPDGGRKKEKVRKVKLSWVGTREVARNRGNIVLSDPVVTDLGDTIRIMVKSTDLVRNFSVFGGIHQARKMRVNDYDQDSGELKGYHLEDDPYVFQKALSKAQRNALGACIPTDYATKMIDRFLRATGATPLMPPSRRAVKSGDKPKASNLKPRAEWDKVTQDQMTDYGKLEKTIWDLSKLQPADLYKQLGVGGRSDMAISAWEAFTTLRELLVPEIKTNNQPG